MSFQTSALIVSWVAILLLALVVSGLVRQVHALSSGLVRRPAGVGLPPGSPAPGLARLLPGHRGAAVLLFVEPGCGTCDDVLDEATRPHSHGASVYAVYRGPVPDGVAVPAHGNQADLFTRYDAVATPFAVLVDPAGRVVRSEPVGSRAAFRGLLAAASTSRAGSPADGASRAPISVQPTRPEGLS